MIIPEHSVHLILCGENMEQLELRLDEVSPMYPNNYTINGIRVSQQEAFGVFQKDQCMRTAAWMQRGGEFFFEHEMRKAKK
jgi:hypothetical protein